MIDLSQIKPLTEAEAEAHFDQPTTPERYEAALVNIRTCVGLEEAQAVERYVALLKQRLAEAREAQYRAESRIQSIRENY